MEAKKAEVKKTFREKVEPFVKNYCFECHGDRKMKGGVTYHPALKNPSDAAYSRRWLMGLATVNAHDMPPEEADKQPTDHERQMFVDWVEQLKYLSPKDPGAFVIRRLTKAEYGNTLHDLLSVDASVVSELPDEVAGEGYMNTLSSLQMEQYLGIANDALKRVLSAKDASPTAVEKRLLGPAPAAGGDERAAAQQVARGLARRAFRRPPSVEELDVLMSVFDLGLRNKLGYNGALRLMLKAVLVSPQFLYITPANEVAAGSQIVPLDDYQLASRLSYLLWSTMPDDELGALADEGKLHEPAVLRAQVARMLKDARSRALFDGFGAQWLGLGDLADKTFDTTKFPQMTPALRTAMYDEGRLFFESIVQENRSVVSFVQSDYTFLNETLAAIYGMEHTVKGAQMRKVKLTDANRGGILGMPGILATTSFPNRTSPVKRGVWVLEQVLGQHVPPAPPNVPTLEKQDKKKIANLTLRQRTELHRTNVVCANCHKILDPIGFGLENFDAIGRWRNADETGGAIDAAGELPGGKRFSAPKELKGIIAARSDELARNLTEKLLAYALCRQLEGYDEIVVDGLMNDIQKNGYRMQSVITAVVTSYPFMNRRVVETVGGGASGKK
ncbi:DUF1592 domain-containing protein [Prosthecobacter sp.]|uniref:DUF1592 domain-containing protein n=1 Tax=Prosthecobacter sp. TaxID=1965333 RepID=UPI0037830709